MPRHLGERGRGLAGRTGWSHLNVVVVAMMLFVTAVHGGVKRGNAVPSFKPLAPPEGVDFTSRDDSLRPAPGVANLYMEGEFPTMGFEAETPLVAFEDDFLSVACSSKKHDVVWPMGELRPDDVMELDSTEQFEDWKMLRKSQSEEEVEIPFCMKFFDFEFVQRVPVQVNKAKEYYDDMYETKARPGGPLNQIGVHGLAKYEVARSEFGKVGVDGSISFFKKFMLDYYQNGQNHIRSDSPHAHQFGWCDFMERNGRMIMGTTMRNAMLDAMLDLHLGKGWVTKELMGEILDYVTFRSEQLGKDWKPGYRVSVPWIELSTMDCRDDAMDISYVQQPSASMQFTTSIPIEMVHDFFKNNEAVHMLSSPQMPKSVVESTLADEYMKGWSRGDKSVAVFIAYMVHQWIARAVVGDEFRSVGNPKNGILFFMSRSNFVSVLNGVRRLREIEGNTKGLALDDKEQFVDDICKVGMVSRDLMRSYRIGVGQRETDQVLGTHENGISIEEWLEGLVDRDHPQDKLKLYHISMSQMGIQVRPKALEMVIEFRQPTHNQQAYGSWPSWATEKAGLLQQMFGPEK